MKSVTFAPYLNLAIVSVLELQTSVEQTNRRTDRRMNFLSSAEAQESLNLAN